MAASKRRNLFRVVYGSIYLLLYVILLGLLLITPADAIERSLRNGQHYNVWLLIFAYVATILVVCFIYFVRLYVNRTDMAAIPKAWIPIEPGDVKKRVHSMIVAALDRSAVISYEARPREKRMGGATGDQNPSSNPVSIEAQDLGISRQLQDAIWRDIEHHGWAPPTSPDLPNLNYSTILSELPNLIEARALTLAPRLGPEEREEDEDNNVDDAEIIDPEAVVLLQRTPGMSLRTYIEHLQSLGVIRSSASVSIAHFLLDYEYARFSKRPISNAQFKELMQHFADVLRSMRPLNMATALRSNSSAASSISEYSGSGTSTSAVGPNDDAASSLAPRSDHLSRSNTMSTQNSVRRPLRSASWGQSYRTAPNTPRSRRVASRRSSKSSMMDDAAVSSSNNSFTQARRRPNAPSTSSLHPASSNNSLRSHASSSIIRLATRDDSDEVLPYVLNLSGTTESLNATPR